jgi:hypothetical protein
MPVNSTFQYSEKRGLGGNSMTTNTFATIIKGYHKFYKILLSGLSTLLSIGDQFLLPYHDKQRDHHHPYCKGHEHDSNHDHTWYATFTNDTCVPVLETLYQGDVMGWKKGNIETLFSIRYSNITTGIASASVFQPPPVCGTNITELEASHVPKWYRFMYF